MDIDMDIDMDMDMVILTASIVNEWDLQSNSDIYRA